MNDFMKADFRDLTKLSIHQFKYDGGAAQKCPTASLVLHLWSQHKVAKALTKVNALTVPRKERRT